MLQHWSIGREKKTTGINIAPYRAGRSQHARFKSHGMCHFVSGLNLHLQPWVVPYVLLSWEGLHYHGWGNGGGGGGRDNTFHESAPGWILKAVSPQSCVPLCNERSGVEFLTLTGPWPNQWWARHGALYPCQSWAALIRESRHSQWSRQICNLPSGGVSAS